MHPYQITCVCKAPQFGDAGLLLAACGPKIVSVNLQTGSVVSQWSAEIENTTIHDQGESEETGPPGKKRKLEKAEATPPNVIKLVVSPDQLFAVAVTGDDKCIRVFEISQDGTLLELSQRCMPKRPCAVLVTPDNKTILCGDKFGDVYSLPLLPKAPEDKGDGDDAAKTQEAVPAKAYTPTATNLTVHTARNRRALESQLRQKDLHAKSKEPLKFEHQLLLGHVSMLTDVLLTTYTTDGNSRQLIITSDRDEHLRISRGLPQAHVIERYCLGHTEFISKLCLLPDSNTFVSGGGDDWIGFWDYISGASLGRCDLKAAIRELTAGDEDTRVAVSGLWAVRGSDDGQSVLLATSEKVSAIFAMPTSTIGTGNVQPTTIALPGYPLDITTSGATILVSYVTEDSASPRLLAYRLRVTDSKPSLELDEEYNGRLQSVNSLTYDFTPSESLIYGVENLRKRGTEDEAA